jgi:hypothetical protein
MIWIVISVILIASIGINLGTKTITGSEILEAILGANHSTGFKGIS